MIRRYQIAANQAPPPYFGPEIITLDKWYQPLEHPRQPKRVHASNVPFQSLVEFQVPPSTSFVTWYQPLSSPRRFPYQVPAIYRPFSVLPPFYPINIGTPEIEYVTDTMPRGWAQPNMPICYIRKYYRFNTYPSNGSTEESPGTQPPRQTM